jgi:hypothetical protein
VEVDGSDRNVRCRSDLIDGGSHQTLHGKEPFGGVHDRTCRTHPPTLRPRIERSFRHTERYNGELKDNKTTI